MSRAQEIFDSTAHLTGVEDKVQALVRASWDMRRSYPKDALELSLRVRELSEHHAYKEGVAYSYRNSGTAYYLLSHYNQALVDLEKALLLFEELSDAHAIGSTLRNIGNVYHSMNFFDESISCYRRALQIARKENDQQGIAYNLGNLGHVFLKMERFDEAKRHMLEGWAILETIDDKLGLADLLNNLGNVYFASGETEQGFAHAKRGLAIAQEIAHLRGAGDAHKLIGKYFLSEKKYDEAIAAFSAGRAVAEEMGELSLIIDILHLLSEASELRGDYESALAYYKLFEAKKSERQQYDQEVLMETLRMKTQVERTILEKEQYKKENAELEKIRRELENLSIVARETENSILILSADGTLEWVNSSFERLNGLKLPEFREKYGRTIFEVSNNPEIRNIIDSCVRSKSTVRYESANYLDDGKVVWESSTLTPIFGENGELHKLIIIDTDVTERKMAEEIVRQKNKDITDSIHYARYLQEAILPPEDGLRKVFSESFIFFRPKDIVSGDFSWFSSASGVALAAAADCTGHGVPGAMMSVLGNEMLNVTVRDPKVHSPATTLDILDGKVREVFANKRTSEGSLMQDGMDIGLIVWHRDEGYVQYAGAKRPLVLVRKGEVQEVRGDRFSIGGRYFEGKKFTEQVVQVQPGDMLYLFSDGYADQFGGPDGKKFMYRNFVRLLQRVSAMEMQEQKSEMEKTFEEWKGDLEQVDDVLVIGIRVEG